MDSSVESESEIVLEETPSCQSVFDKFLRYLYTAEVTITISTAVGILCLADKYNVTSLKELCTKYVMACTYGNNPSVHRAQLTLTVCNS